MSAEKNEAGLYEVDIDGAKYEFAKWGAEESLANLIKLSKLIGKPLGIALTAFKTEDKPEDSLFGNQSGILDRDIDANVIGMAIDALTTNLDESSAISLIKKLSSQGVFCDHAKIDFNKHYQDRLDHLFKVVYAALEVQYGNFIGAVSGLLGPKKGKGVTNRASRT